MKRSHTTFSRNCPMCGVEIYHTSACNLNKMLKRNSPCRVCYMKSRRTYDVADFSRTCGKCGNVKVFSSLSSYRTSRNRGDFVCRGCIIKSKGPRSIDVRNKIRLAKVGIPRSTESIKKMRIAAAKRISVSGICPRINQLACNFIESYGKENGYEFQHGLNGGERYFPDIGVWVDGYDALKNVVFEYDEPRHYYSNGELKPKDVTRMKLLKEHINCKVIRYNELKSTIQEY